MQWWCPSHSNVSVRERRNKIRSDRPPAAWLAEMFPSVNTAGHMPGPVTYLMKEYSPLPAAFAMFSHVPVRFHYHSFLLLIRPVSWMGSAAGFYSTA